MMRERQSVEELPPTVDLPEWSWLLRLVRRAERISGIEGLASFLLAKAKQASDGVPSAIYDGDRGVEAFRRYRRESSYQLYFRANPWWPGEHEQERGRRLDDRWSFLGGWFGLPPVVALATTDGAGRRHDPSYVFMPQFAVAYASDVVVRLLGGVDMPTWVDVWRRWSRVLPVVHASTQTEGSFEEFLQRAVRWGAEPAIATRCVSARRYPGFARLARELQASESHALDGGWSSLVM